MHLGYGGHLCRLAAAVGDVKGGGIGEHDALLGVEHLDHQLVAAAAAAGHQDALDAQGAGGVDELQVLEVHLKCLAMEGATDHEGVGGHGLHMVARAEVQRAERAEDAGQEDLVILTEILW